MISSLPPAVMEAWLRSRGVAQVVPVGGGLSGAIVFRAHGEGGRAWALRGWPTGTSGRRVDEVHRAMRQARREGCWWTPGIEPPDAGSLLPGLPTAGVSSRLTEAAGGGEGAGGGEPRSWIVAGDRVWDCCQWMPGQPPAAGADPADVLVQTAAAVARFHAATQPLATHRGPAAAVTSRLRRLAELEPQVDRLITRRGAANPLLAGGSAVGRAVECLREVWGTRSRHAATMLESWSRLPLRQQYVIRDIHIGNTLFHEGRLSGIVDYDAVRVDSPATDLARLINSVQLWLPPEQWNRAAESLWAGMLGAYRAVSPLSSDEAQLARVLCVVSPLIVLANWAVWVGLEGRRFPGPANRVAERIEGWGKIVREQSRSREGVFRPESKHVDPFF